MTRSDMNPIWKIFDWIRSDLRITLRTEGAHLEKHQEEENNPTARPLHRTVHQDF